jgi:hypothetical protein
MAYIFASQGLRKNRIGAIELDLTIDETHLRNADITDFPVEGGGQIQDHISNQPKRLKITGFITDSPIEADSSLANRVQDAFDALDELFDKRITFDVVSGLKVYTNMAFESLEMPLVQQGSCQFTATLKQITITHSELVSLPKSKSNVGAKKQDAGRKNTETPTPAEEKKSQDTITNVWDRVVGK